MIIQRILILVIATEVVKSKGAEEDLAIYQQSDQWQFGTTDTMSKVARAIVKKILSIEQAEGVGARVRRSVGRPEVYGDNIKSWAAPLCMP